MNSDPAISRIPVPELKDLPPDVREADYETLDKAGFTREEAWDIGAIAAFFAMSNRIANMFNMRPNDEFYLLGRVPKERK